jgi:hypothetical protein
MKPPLPLQTKMYHLKELSEGAASKIQTSLSKLRGVREVLVVASEQIACIKVEQTGYDEEGVRILVEN